MRSLFEKHKNLVESENDLIIARTETDQSDNNNGYHILSKQNILLTALSNPDLSIANFLLSKVNTIHRENPELALGIDGTTKTQEEMFLREYKKKIAKVITDLTKKVIREYYNRGREVNLCNYLQQISKNPSCERQVIDLLTKKSARIDTYSLHGNIICTELGFFVLIIRI